MVFISGNENPLFIYVINAECLIAAAQFLDEPEINILRFHNIVIRSLKKKAEKHGCPADGEIRSRTSQSTVQMG